jgi:FlaA1/EpsC-like NDP-sugar epimerase
LNLKVSLNNLMIFFALIFGILLYRKFIFNNQINFLIALIPLIFITVLILIRLYSHQKVEQKLQYFWIKHFALIFHSSCLIFGFLHIFNFEEITINLVLLSPLVVLPQVILGYALGFLRMNYGFHYNVIFHILWNSLFTLFYIN